MISTLSICVTCFSSVSMGAGGDQAEGRAADAQARAADAEADPMKALIGEWEGVSRTWQMPGKLSDASKVRGKITPLLGGRFLRHAYEGTMMGQPRMGEETIVFNAVEKQVEVSWFDNCHMSYALMFSTGQKTDKGFSVTGHYRMAPGQAPWAWKTVFELIDQDHLTITAYNISPQGHEAKAVETVYERRSPSTASETKPAAP